MNRMEQNNKGRSCREKRTSITEAALAALNRFYFCREFLYTFKHIGKEKSDHEGWINDQETDPIIRNFFTPEK